MLYVLKRTGQGIKSLCFALGSAMDDIKNLVSEAYEITKNQEKPNISILAKDFRVSRDYLCAYFTSQPFRSEYHIPYKTLDDTQENTII